MSCAVALPDGNRNFSRTMMGTRKGEAKNMPKLARVQGTMD